MRENPIVFLVYVWYPWCGQAKLNRGFLGGVVLMVRANEFEHDSRVCARIGRGLSLQAANEKAETQRQ